MPSKVTWRLRRLNKYEWEGWIQIPTLTGLPIGVTARAFSPQAAQARTLAVAQQVAKAPGLSALLPPQAKMALTAAKIALPLVKNLGKKAYNLFKSIF
jgi:hypothetical protein